VDSEEAARLIEANPDFRLLRRVPAPTAWSLQKAVGETRRGVFVDTETTGLDPDTDEVIELALLPFEYERDTGAIVSVDQDAALNAFRQPSFPIPPESAKIHGLTDEMVARQIFDPEHIRVLIEPAHIVIGITQPSTGRWWKSTGLSSKRSSACSFAEIDWKSEGIGSGKLDYLLWSRLVSGWPPRPL
jgi:DNA polymerase III subunit epsilon